MYHVSVYVAIIGYTEPLQSPFLLSAMPPYTGQCLHTGSVLYRCTVFVMPLYYEIYKILKSAFFKLTQTKKEKKSILEEYHLLGYNAM
jgi:hypothetical protein